MTKMRDELTKISTGVKAVTIDEAARLQKVLTELGDIETNLSQDFPSRGQSISDLVYNIIGVRNAQASEDYNKEIGSITWITFIFFPLIAVSVSYRIYPPIGTNCISSTDLSVSSVGYVWHECRRPCRQSIIEVVFYHCHSFHGSSITHCSCDSRENTDQESNGGEEEASDSRRGG